MLHPNLCLPPQHTCNCFLTLLTHTFSFYQHEKNPAQQVDPYGTLGWSDFFGLTEDGTKPKVRHDLKVQIQFSAQAAHAQQSFHFQKIPGSLNINIFW